MSTPETPDTSATGFQGESPLTNTAEKKSTIISTPLDAWIDKLTEFEETKLETPQVDGSQLSIADALLKLEARRDVPGVTLTNRSFQDPYTRQGAP